MKTKRNFGRIMMYAVLILYAGITLYPSLWMVAVPLTALSALVLDAPVWVVCIALQGESLCKPLIGFLRFRSKKWINDVTQATKQ